MPLIELLNKGGAMVMLVMADGPKTAVSAGCQGAKPVLQLASLLKSPLAGVGSQVASTAAAGVPVSSKVDRAVPQCVAVAKWKWLPDTCSHVGVVAVQRPTEAVGARTGARDLDTRITRTPLR